MAKHKETGWQMQAGGVLLAVAVGVAKFIEPSLDTEAFLGLLGFGAGMVGVGAPYRLMRAKQAEVQPQVDSIIEDVNDLRGE